MPDQRSFELAEVSSGIENSTLVQGVTSTKEVAPKDTLQSSWNEQRNYHDRLRPAGWQWQEREDQADGAEDYSDVREDGLRYSIHFVPAPDGPSNTQWIHKITPFSLRERVRS
jgi:hypothetical protein